MGKQKLKAMQEEQKIKKFWEWVAANEHKYLFLSNIASENPEELERLVSKLQKALQGCYPEGVAYEIGGKNVVQKNITYTSLLGEL